MELFSKVYSCYYQVAARILEASLVQSVSVRRMQEICAQYGFAESGVHIVPKMAGGGWNLMGEEGKGRYVSKLSAIRKTPVTLLQKRWLKALGADKRFSLFFTEEEYGHLMEALSDVEPLFCIDDFYYFDRYLDGDPYEKPEYRRTFRLLLEALNKERILEVTYLSPKMGESRFKFLPCRFQYSGKDDKMRVLGVRIEGRAYGKMHILNLGRIRGIESCDLSIPCAYHFDEKLKERKKGHADIEISGERNSLERCMLHFANYEKQTVYQEEKGVYTCTLYYDLDAETEVLIEVLSFGPVIRVTGPERFLALIRERVIKQHYLLDGIVKDNR